MTRMSMSYLSISLSQYLSFEDKFLYFQVFSLHSTTELIETAAWSWALKIIMKVQTFFKMLFTEYSLEVNWFLYVRMNCFKHQRKIGSSSFKTFKLSWLQTWQCVKRTAFNTGLIFHRTGGITLTGLDEITWLEHSLSHDYWLVLIKHNQAHHQFQYIYHSQYHLLEKIIFVNIIIACYALDHYTVQTLS